MRVTIYNLIYLLPQPHSHIPLFPWHSPHRTSIIIKFFCAKKLAEVVVWTLTNSIIHWNSLQTEKCLYHSFAKREIDEETWSVLSSNMELSKLLPRLNSLMIHIPVLETQEDITQGPWKPLAAKKGNQHVSAMSYNILKL